MVLCVAVVSCGSFRQSHVSVAQDQQVVVETGVRVKIRDGVHLVADIFRPSAPGKYPVLLTRTPYNRRDPATGTLPGVSRLRRYRTSTRKSELLKLGEVYTFDVDPWATSNVFKAGHRIRLYVSSSSFPRFNRNLNTGEPNARATRAVMARQTVYHDGDRRSALVPPIVEATR